MRDRDGRERKKTDRKRDKSGIEKDRKKGR